MMNAESSVDRLRRLYERCFNLTREAIKIRWRNFQILESNGFGYYDELDNRFHYLPRPIPLKLKGVSV